MTVTLDVERDTSSARERTRVRPLKGGYMMYYVQPNGHVAPASAQKMDMSNFIDRGWRPLKRYGSYVADHVNINRPLDHLFRKGGAKELPISQLLDEGFAYPLWGATGDQPYAFQVLALNPETGKTEVVGEEVAEFPQLVGVTLPPLENCHHCGRRGTHDQIEAHEEVQHQKDLAPVKMAQALGQALKGQSTDLKVETKSQPFPYICGACGDGFTGHMALARHVKGEHRNDA